MPTPFLTPVQDTLYTPEGTLVTGTLILSTTATFTSADGYTILQGFSLRIPVADGVLSVNLVPNAGSTPASTYFVQVQCTDGFFEQTWSVPHSSSPVNLAAVIVD